MSFVFEFVWQIVFEFILGGPGAFILWSFSGFKGSYLDTLALKQNKSAIIGLLFWIMVAAVGSWIARLEG